jgi:hypothetical protein
LTLNQNSINDFTANQLKYKNIFVQLLNTILNEGRAKFLILETLDSLALVPALRQVILCSEKLSFQTHDIFIHLYNTKVYQIIDLNN